MISLYVGYALYAVFPYASYLPQTPAMPALAASIAVFIGLSFIAYLVLRRTVASDFVSIGFFGLIVLAFLGAGFLLALAYHVFPVRDVYTFTPTIDALFASKQFFFAWIVAPLVGLFFFVR
jgi:FtsH-binding integral membrane protein